MTPAHPTTPPAADGPTQPTLTTLVSGILDDAQRLFKQQFDMVKAEVRDDLRKARQMVVFLGVGAALSALGGVLLIVALVHTVQYLTGWHLAGCWGLVGGLCVLAGGVALAVGARLLSKNNPLPDKSFNALQENVSWIANPQT